MKFCGLDHAVLQSGAFRAQAKLSKFGNARPRRTLWLAGQVAIRQRDDSFRYKFERYIACDRDNPDLRRVRLADNVRRKMNGEILYSLNEARIVIESWRCHYNICARMRRCATGRQRRKSS